MRTLVPSRPLPGIAPPPRLPGPVPPRPVLGLDLVGSVVATVLLCLSFTPSLLPRGWVVQGVVSGLCAATGYALGCLPRAIGYALLPLPRVAAEQGWARRRSSTAASSWFAVPAVPATMLTAYQGWRWQQEVSGIVGVAGPSPLTWPGALPVAAGVFAALLGTARLVSRERRGPAAATMIVLLVLAGGQLPPALGALSSTLDSRVTDLAAPADPTRSGSPASLVPWATLGRQGRAFVTGALTARHSQQPIRVYAGLRTAPTTSSRARLAVAELERTGAFSRKALCIVVPTGSGWIDEPTVAALEDELDGDTAVVAIQYSALPSWLALATESERAEAAAGDLLDEVHRTWSALPAATRPQLLLYGHSLGALAAQAPFSTADRLLDKVDGALISGPPSGSALHSRLVADRSPATIEALPALTGRPDIRFAAGPADLTTVSATRPRLVFLQHPTDPVVWWSPSLILHRPDWSREPRGDGVLPSVRWCPVVTFWQVSADLLRAQDVPAGYGHRYGDEARAAWHLITTDTSLPGSPS